jgi:hypothetical protein
MMKRSSRTAITSLTMTAAMPPPGGWGSHGFIQEGFDNPWNQASLSHSIRFETGCWQNRPARLGLCGI